jgi:phage gp36-like protein
MAAQQYAQTSDLYSLSVFSAALNTISSADQNAALLAASERLDSYLRQKFSLPLLLWGQDVKQWVCDVAAFMLLSKRGFNPQNAGDALIVKRYDDQIAWAKGVARGEIVPDVVDSSPGAQAGSPIDEATVITSPQRGWSQRGSGQAFEVIPFTDGAVSGGDVGDGF